MSFLLAVLSLAMTANAAKPFQLVTPTDSISYAVGMSMSSALRTSMPQKYLRSKKAIASYAKGFENVSLYYLIGALVLLLILGFILFKSIRSLK